ncbi:MAG: APC family permease [Candidatus Omnitrophica bacterium]|nr:APC family permease [Candidatus Omnitrophota bacterium]
MEALYKKIKSVVIGKAKNPLDTSVFHKLSLIAFFAWIGLGADGLSSSCYGPEAAFVALNGHTYLSIFVALATAFTVFIISTSYSQIIELFPSGGGGYLVASKLLSPTVGMFSGCALMIDYVLTIAISIASGMDAVFSFLPPAWLPFKLEFTVFALLMLTIMNMRGVKESVIPLAPIFLTFLLTHIFAIIYAISTHIGNFPAVVQATGAEVSQVSSQIGVAGMIFLILRSYSLGAGTYTGIEAVSNGLPILREPKVATGRRTMQYMAFSLAFTVLGLMVAYLLFKVTPTSGKTLNAILFENISKNWGFSGHIFLVVTLISEGALLLIAAQAGFLDGPRVLANMAIDRWFPIKFANLSDRLVTQNGVLIMGGAALGILLLTHGSVAFLVVLYSINVFITFLLSQLGMVRHWWNVRLEFKRWKKKILINGVGLVLTAFILVSVVVIKFHEGGWITLLVTFSLSAVALLIRRHYLKVAKLLRRLNSLVQSTTIPNPETPAKPKFEKSAKTAVLLVSGFNGLGLHTLFNIIRFFGKEFRNFVFVEVGLIDAGNFKGLSEVSNLKEQINKDLKRYIDFMQGQGFYAEGLPFMGVDVINEVEKIIPIIAERFPNAVVFGGQLVFPQESLLTRFLHNDTVFSLQRIFYQKGIPFVILPIRVY